VRESARSGNDSLVASIAGYARAVAGDCKEAQLLMTRLLEPPPQPQEERIEVDKYRSQRRFIVF
jgi:hypothetical protein